MLSPWTRRETPELSQLSQPVICIPETGKAHRKLAGLFRSHWSNVMFWHPACFHTDYIDVLDTYCHPNAKGNIETSSHRDMYVRFTSDASIVYRGFRLAYRAINVQTTTTIPITTTRTTTTTPRTTITTTTTTPTTTTAAVASPTPCE